MKNSVMEILSQGIGHCAMCGDTQGPWGWYEDRWLCEDCGEKVREKNNCFNSAALFSLGHLNHKIFAIRCQPFILLAL